MRLEDLVIFETSKIRKALQSLEKTGKKLLIVVDNNNKVNGVLTDGDVRRGLLNGESLDIEVRSIMNKDFLFFRENNYSLNIQEKALNMGIDAIPILDEKDRLVNIIWLNSRIERNIYENKIIIMAGGRGKRLHPITEEIPKPMIEINGLPMIHHLILRLKKQGFYKFIISVNYKKEIIKSYLGDGSKFDIEVNYIEEKKPLGTAGSLALIPELIEPAILLNADIITDIYFQDLITQNKQNNSDLIMVTKNEKISISYGVVETQGKEVLSIKEKPNFDFLINTGIYLITEEVRKLVKKNQFLDMPDLVRKCLAEKLKVEHFLCTNNWLDIGRFETLKKAKEFI